jgi:hypothetical protein
MHSAFSGRLTCCALNKGRKRQNKEHTEFSNHPVMEPPVFPLLAGASAPGHTNCRAFGPRCSLRLLVNHLINESDEVTSTNGVSSPLLVSPRFNSPTEVNKNKLQVSMKTAHCGSSVRWSFSHFWRLLSNPAKQVPLRWWDWWRRLEGTVTARPLRAANANRLATAYRVRVP